MTHTRVSLILLTARFQAKTLTQNYSLDENSETSELGQENIQMSSEQQ